MGIPGAKSRALKLRDTLLWITSSDRRYYLPEIRREIVNFNRKQEEMIMKCRIKAHIPRLSFVVAAIILISIAGCSTKQPSSNTASSASSSQAANQNSAAAANAPVDSANPTPSGQSPGSPSADTSSQPGASAGALPAAPAGSTAGGSPETAAAPAPPPPPRTFTLASGRSIAVYTTRQLTTKENKTGEPFTATLASSIVDGDWVIAQRGATVEGVITNSDPGGRVKGVASITVQLKRLTLADGRTVPISTSGYVKKARTTKKKDAAKIGIGAGAGAVIGAIAGGGKGAAIGAGVGGAAGTGVVLATRGDPAVIPGESQLKFKLTAPVVITQRRPE